MGDRTDRQGSTPVSDPGEGPTCATTEASTGLPTVPEGGPAPDLAGFTLMSSVQHHAGVDGTPVVHVALPMVPGAKGLRRWVTLTTAQAADLGTGLLEAAIAANEAAKAAHHDPLVTPVPQPEVEP